MMMADLLPWFVGLNALCALVALTLAVRTHHSAERDKRFVAVDQCIAELEQKVAACGDRTVQQAAIGRIDLVEDRVTRVEQDMKHLPDHATTHRLEISITELRGEVARLGEQIKPVAAISARLQETILEEARAR